MQVRGVRAIAGMKRTTIESAAEAFYARPMVEAALEAADAYQKPKSEEPR